MANPLAPLAVLLWAPFCLVLFAHVRPTVAASISIVGATILLPADYAFDMKGLPAINRELIGSLAALIGCLVYARVRLARPSRGYGVDLLAVAMIAGGFLTAYTNGDPLRMGGKYLPGTPLWGGVSRAAGVVLTFWLPLYLGRSLFRSPRDLRILVLVLALAGVFYGLPVLWEARMSPQLHNWLYGYMPASFAQAKRPTGWGWRPMVFVGHGLALATFMAMCCVAVTALWRQRVRIRGVSLGYALPWVYFVLLMCQSMAALVYATIAIPIVAFAKLRWNRVILAGIVVVVFSYPALRAADLFPTEALVSTAAAFHEGRSRSLNFRFTNEDLLLERARERLWLGWGGYGRERIYDERGRSETVSDGYWVITLGQTGIVGFVCSFGMILLPPVVAIRALHGRRASEDSLTVVAASWILALSAVDLLPNGFLNARTLFTGGALLGAVGGWKHERGRKGQPGRSPAHTPAPPPRGRDSAGGGEEPAQGGLAGGLLRRRRSGLRG